MITSTTVVQAAPPRSGRVSDSPRQPSRLSGPGRWLALIMVAHVALGLWYSLANPLFEAGDERWHYPYVKALADGQGLPVQPEDPIVYNWRQEGSQPPLYYLLAAALTFPIDTGPPRRVVVDNPHAIVGQPLAFGNKNLAVADPDPEGADRGVVLAALLIRAFSVLIGAITVWATYVLARQIAPHAPGLALLAAAWVAFLPEFVFISASINNDVLAVTASSVCLVAINWALQQPRVWPRWLWVGLVGGAAALSKLNGVGVIGLAVLAIGWSAWRSVDRRWVPAALGAALGPPTAIAGWWFARNQLLYGDPTGLSAMLAIVGRRSLSWTKLAGEAPGILYSFWGVLGGFNVLLPDWLYSFYNALAVAALIGLLIQVARPRWSRTGAINRLLLALALIWLAFTGYSLIRWTQTTMGSQGRLLFPALPVFALLFAWGCAGWAPARWRPRLIGTLAVAFFGAAALVPSLVIGPAYAPPRRLEAGQIDQVPNRLHATFEDRIELIGYQFGRPDGSLRTAQAGQTLAVTLYWRTNQRLDENLSIYVHLLDRQNRVLGQSNSYPGAGTYPTSLWQPGEIVPDVTYLVVGDDAPLPALARLEVGLYHSASLERLPARGDRVRPHQSVYLTDLRVTRSTPPPALPNAAGLRFGDQIELIDFASDPTGPVAPGSPLRIDLRWRALAALPLDYTTFLHLIDGSGQLVAQADAEPRSGTYPTSVWQPAEIVPDSYLLPVPATAVAGRYALRVGLYRRDTGERLPVAGGGDGAPALTTIEVAP